MMKKAVISMLKRKLYADLLEWKKNDSHSKAVFLMGARQTGKSTLARTFGRENYKQVIEINFLEDPGASKIFKAGSAEEILVQLTAYTQKQIIPKETLIILDEIQECPAARTAIKFLVQDQRCSYIETGSLLGLSCKAVKSYPVGFEQEMKMYPLDFEEFLWAVGFLQESIDHLRDCYHKKESVGEAAHEVLMRLFRTFIVTGGMPEVVQRFVDTKDMTSVFQVQHSILQLYRSDISKFTAGIMSLRIKQIFDSIPAQLDQKNRRFKINALGKGRQFRDLESSFLWLEEAAVALHCYNTAAPVRPLILNEKRNLFRLYMNDTGLLCAAIGPQIQSEILQKNYSVNCGSILENVYAQALTSKGLNLYYYDSKKPEMELDFVVENGSAVDILEIKSGKDYKKHTSLDKALSMRDWSFGKAIVFCDSDLQEEGSILYLPMYMVMFYAEKEAQHLIWDPLDDNFLF